MPTYRVKTASGTYDIEAEDDAAASRASSFLTTEAKPKPSRMESFGRGISDPPKGIAQAAINMGYVPPPQVSYGSKKSQAAYGDMAAIKPDALAEQANRDIATEEEDYQSRRGPDAGVDWSRLGGNVLGSAPLMAVGGAPATVGRTLAAGAARPALGGGAFLGRNALAGGLQSASMPVTDAEGSYFGQKAEQAAIGAGAGALVGGLVAGTGNVLAPRLSKAQKYLTDRGVDLTFGQLIGKAGARLEQAVTSIPGLGDVIMNAQRRTVKDFNKAAYNEALKPVGLKYTGEAGHAGIKDVGDQLSGMYDTVLPRLTLKMDRELSADFTDIAGVIEYMTEEKAGKFAKILQTDIFPQDAMALREFTGETVKQIQTKINKHLATYSKSMDPDDQTVAEALREMQKSIREGLTRSNPNDAALLNKIDQGWSKLAVLERAAAGSKDEGLFSPEGLAAAVKASDTSVRKRATARGTMGDLQEFAEAGLELLGRKVPDSGTPTRMIAGGAAAGYLDPSILTGMVAGSIPYIPAVQRGLNSVFGSRTGVPFARHALEAGAFPATVGLSGLINAPRLPNKR